MTWQSLGERLVHRSKWFDLNLADVLLPDGRHLDHYVLRQPPVAVCACVNDRDEVLLLWRDRFILDSVAYELPSGGVEPGEDIEIAAVRETVEETGWKPGPMQHLVTIDSNPGLSDCQHHVWWADGATYCGAPADAFEPERVEWVPLSKTDELIASGQVRLGNTAIALLMLCRLRGL